MSKQRKVYIRERRIKRKSSYSNFFGNTGGGYSGASGSRQFRLWNYVSGLADSEILLDLPVLRARCRDLYRNNPYGRAPITTLCQNVVGSGIFLQSTPDRKILGGTDEFWNKWEDDVERRFWNWSSRKECDITRQSNFYDLQNLIYLSSLASGETFITMPLVVINGKRQLALNIIEADLVQNKAGQFNSRTCRDGIELDDNGAPKSYSVRINDFEWKTISAYGENSGRPNIIHFFRQERPGQTRGVPLLSSVLEEIKQIDRYSKHTLISAIVQGLFSVFIKSNNPDVLKNLVPGTDETPTSSSALDDDAFSYELAPGSVHHLADGEDVSFANPSVPQQQFEAFINAHLVAIGMATGVPFELLKKQFNASYSASRASRVEAWRYFLMEREKFIRDVLDIIFQEWLTIEILEGRISAPYFFDDYDIKLAYCGSTWLGSTMGQIDEGKEVAAAISRIGANLSTYSEETLKLTGGDYFTNVEILKKERALLQDIQQKQQETTDFVSSFRKIKKYISGMASIFRGKL